MMETTIVGLDIGGANIKAATPFGNAYTLPFELWRRPGHLPEAIREVLSRWPNAERIAVTMTGELCDCFATKREGVRHILDSVAAIVAGLEVRVWSTDGSWKTLEEAKSDPFQVAAGNWHALATFAGRLHPSGFALLLDTGTTTTDIIPLRAGVPAPTGLTDPARLLSGELVYTGVRRAPVCALIQQGAAAEWFATTLDVYLILGMIAEDPQDRNTADGRPATAPAAHARMARMLGGDAETTPAAETRGLAERVFAAQKSLIAAGIRAVCSRRPDPLGAVIFAGSGEFLARAAWAEHLAASARPVVEPRVVSLSASIGFGVSSAACAYALALLRAESCS